VGAVRKVGRRLFFSAQRWWRDQHADDAAALAFYSLISLVPILLVGVYVASIFVDEETARQMIVEETHHVAGKSVGQYFGSIMGSEIKWAGSAYSPVLGGLLLLFSATKMIAELRKSLGKVFGVPGKQAKRKPVAGIAGRLMAVVMLLVLGGMIAMVVVLDAMLGVVAKSLPEKSMLLTVVTWSAPLVSFMAVSFLAAVAMRWLPQNPPRFSEAIRGGVVSAVLLVLLKFGLAIALQYSDLGSVYGSAFVLVLVLFWIYFAMQVFLFGAEYASELVSERRRRQSRAR